MGPKKEVSGRGRKGAPREAGSAPPAALGVCSARSTWAQALAGDSVREGGLWGGPPYGRGWFRASLTGRAPPPFPGGNTVTKRRWARVHGAGSGAGPSEAAVPAPQMRAPCLNVDTPEEVAPGGHRAWEGTHLEGTSGGHLSQCRTAQGDWAHPTVQRGWQGGFAASETITRDPRSRPASPVAGCAPLPAPPLPAQGPPPSPREAHGHGG